MRKLKSFFKESPPKWIVHIVAQMFQNRNKTQEEKNMAKTFLTDEQVEKEIERLRQSPMVALARKEQRLKYKRRQFLYQLRGLEKKGEELAAAGITPELLDEMSGEE